MQTQLTLSTKLFNNLMNSKPREYREITNVLDATNISDIYLSSDLHFGGVNNDYDIKIARNNSIITKNKVLIYLGDLGYKKCNNRDLIRDCARNLSKGKYSIFICGNHDIYEPTFYTKECGFNIYCKEGFIYKNMCFTHMPIKDRNNPNNLINIHGHLHTKTIETEPYYQPIMHEYSKTRYIRVFNDINDYYPIALSKLLLKSYIH